MHICTFIHLQSVKRTEPNKSIRHLENHKHTSALTFEHSKWMKYTKIKTKQCKNLHIYRQCILYNRVNVNLRSISIVKETRTHTKNRALSFECYCSFPSFSLLTLLSLILRTNIYTHLCLYQLLYRAICEFHVHCGTEHFFHIFQGKISSAKLWNAVKPYYSTGGKFPFHACANTLGRRMCRKTRFLFRLNDGRVHDLYIINK